MVGREEEDLQTGVWLNFSSTTLTPARSSTISSEALPYAVSTQSTSLPTIVSPASSLPSEGFAFCRLRGPESRTNQGCDPHDFD